MGSRRIELLTAAFCETCREGETDRKSGEEIPSFNCIVFEIP